MKKPFLVVLLVIVVLSSALTISYVHAQNSSSSKCPWPNQKFSSSDPNSPHSEVGYRKHLQENKALYGLADGDIETCVQLRKAAGSAETKEKPLEELPKDDAKETDNDGETLGSGNESGGQPSGSQQPTSPTEPPPEAPEPKVCFENDCGHQTNGKGVEAQQAPTSHYDRPGLAPQAEAPAGLTDQEWDAKMQSGLLDGSLTDAQKKYILETGQMPPNGYGEASSPQLPSGGSAQNSGGVPSYDAFDESDNLNTFSSDAKIQDAINASRDLTVAEAQQTAAQERYDNAPWYQKLPLVPSEVKQNLSDANTAVTDAKNRLTTAYLDDRTLVLDDNNQTILQRPVGGAEIGSPTAVVKDGEVVSQGTLSKNTGLAYAVLNDQSRLQGYVDGINGESGAANPSYQDVVRSIDTNNDTPVFSSDYPPPSPTPQPAPNPNPDPQLAQNTGVSGLSPNDVPQPGQAPTPNYNGPSIADNICGGGEACDGSLQNTDLRRVQTATQLREGAPSQTDQGPTHVEVVNSETGKRVRVPLGTDVGQGKTLQDGLLDARLKEGNYHVVDNPSPELMELVRQNPDAFEIPKITGDGQGTQVAIHESLLSQNPNVANSNESLGTINHRDVASILPEPLARSYTTDQLRQAGINPDNVTLTHQRSNDMVRSSADTPLSNPVSLTNAIDQYGVNPENAGFSLTQAAPQPPLLDNGSVLAGDSQIANTNSNFFNAAGPSGDTLAPPGSLTTAANPANVPASQPVIPSGAAPAPSPSTFAGDFDGPAAGGGAPSGAGSADTPSGAATQNASNPAPNAPPSNNTNVANDDWGLADRAVTVAKTVLQPDATGGVPLPIPGLMTGPQLLSGLLGQRPQTPANPATPSPSAPPVSGTNVAPSPNQVAQTTPEDQNWLQWALGWQPGATPAPAPTAPALQTIPPIQLAQATPPPTIQPTPEVTKPEDDRVTFQAPTPVEPSPVSDFFNGLNEAVNPFYVKPAVAEPSAVAQEVCQVHNNCGGHKAIGVAIDEIKRAIAKAGGQTKTVTKTTTKGTEDFISYDTRGQWLAAEVLKRRAYIENHGWDTIQKQDAELAKAINNQAAEASARLANVREALTKLGRQDLLNKKLDPNDVQGLIATSMALACSVGGACSEVAVSEKDIDEALKILQTAGLAVKKVANTLAATVKAAGSGTTVGASNPDETERAKEAPTEATGPREAARLVYAISNGTTRKWSSPARVNGLSVAQHMQAAVTRYNDKHGTNFGVKIFSDAGPLGSRRHRELGDKTKSAPCACAADVAVITPDGTEVSLWNPAVRKIAIDFVLHTRGSVGGSGQAGVYMGATRLHVDFVTPEALRPGETTEWYRWARSMKPYFDRARAQAKGNVPKMTYITNPTRRISSIGKTTNQLPSGANTGPAGTGHPTLDSFIKDHRGFKLGSPDSTTPNTDKVAAAKLSPADRDKLKVYQHDGKPVTDQSGKQVTFGDYKAAEQRRAQAAVDAAAKARELNKRFGSGHTVTCDGSTCNVTKNGNAAGTMQNITREQARVAAAARKAGIATTFKDGKVFDTAGNELTLKETEAPATPSEPRFHAGMCSELGGRGCSRCASRNNPGCIKNFGAKWVGMSADQSGDIHVNFDTPEAGFRAIAKNMESYERRGIQSVYDRIKTWAPANSGEGNRPWEYAQDVAAKMGISPTQPFSIKDPNLGPKFLKEMARREAGASIPYTMQQARDGWELAFKNTNAEAAAKLEQIKATNQSIGSGPSYQLVRNNSTGAPTEVGSPITNAQLPSAGQTVYTDQNNNATVLTETPTGKVAVSPVVQPDGSLGLEYKYTAPSQPATPTRTTRVTQATRPSGPLQTIQNGWRRLTGQPPVSPTPSPSGGASSGGTSAPIPRATQPPPPVLPPIGETVASLSCTPNPAVVNDESVRVRAAWRCENAISSTGLGSQNGATRNIETAGSLVGVADLKIDLKEDSNTAKLGVSCMTPLGETVEQMCTIDLLKPSITMSTTPLTITAGIEMTIRWAAFDLSSNQTKHDCTLFGPDGVLAESRDSGEVTLTAPDISTEYIVMCDTDEEPVFERLEVSIDAANGEVELTNLPEVDRDPVTNTPIVAPRYTPLPEGSCHPYQGTKAYTTCVKESK